MRRADNSAAIRVSLASIFQFPVHSGFRAPNYGLSLFVLMLAPVWRPRAARFKGTAMGAYGLFVLLQVGMLLASGGCLAVRSAWQVIGQAWHELAELAAVPTT